MSDVAETIVSDMAETLTPPKQAVQETEPERPLPTSKHRAWAWLSGAWAAFLGLLPHVLHHAGPLAGAALFAGVAGSLLFGALGLVAAVPFLLRLHRRSGGWRLPLAALALFAVLFSISAFLIGPALSGGSGGDDGASSTGANPLTEPNQGGPAHDAHH